MTNVILIRYGEIMLKGLNRPIFENKLISNIRKELNDLGKIKIIKSSGRIFIEPEYNTFDYTKALNKLTKIFGIVSVSLVWKIETNYETIKEKSILLVREILDKNEYNSFKVETKREDKNFPYKSPEISSNIGAFILDNIPSLKVDVINPDFILYIEVRDNSYLYFKKIPGVSGMPVGTNGKALVLLSGGIDSPVAAWMIAKRGVKIEAIHFYSYPYTSERAKEKVIELTKLISKYCNKIKLHIVPFTQIQLEINSKCPSEVTTIVLRRIMMNISEKLAKNIGAKALVTGESLGQVASQTIESLFVTNEVVDMPVFRPLIGMDKNEIIDIAKKIDTFETSILPYEDCCTVFVAKHPITRPDLDKIKKYEQKLDLDKLISDAMSEIQVF